MGKNMQFNAIESYEDDLFQTWPDDTYPDDSQ
jgi:hypothetical protein